MRPLLALLCLFTVWHWPTMARAETIGGDRETQQLTLHVDLLRLQLRLLEIEAHAHTLDAIEDALVARATAQLALVQLSALPPYEPRPRWGRGAYFALGVAIGAATGALIGAAWALGR